MSFDLAGYYAESRPGVFNGQNGIEVDIPVDDPTLHGSDVCIDNLSAEQARGVDTIVGICKRTITDLRTQNENQQNMLKRAEAEAFKWEQFAKEFYEYGPSQCGHDTEELTAIYKLFDPRGENVDQPWPGRYWINRGRTAALVRDLFLHNEANKAEIERLQKQVFELQEQINNYRDRVSTAINDVLGAV